MTQQSVEDDKLREIVAMAAKATPGPWHAYEHPEKPSEIQIGGGEVGGGGDGWDEWCVAAAWGGLGEETLANAALIAACDPQTITNIINELLASREKLKAVEQGWQTIDSAPKPVGNEIIRILAIYPDEGGSRVDIVHWRETGSGGYWSSWATETVMGKRYMRANQPTHWRPLPSPPSPENSHG